MAAAALALMIEAAGTAKASFVIALDSQPTGTFTTLTEAGFTLSQDPGGHLLQVADLGGGNRALIEDDPDDGFGTFLTITRIGGGTFSLDSLDIANLANPGGGPSATGTDSGYRIELTSDLGDIVAYTTGSGAFSTVAPGGFADITSLGINIVSSSSDGLTFAVDNITLTSTAVPEPSSLALSGVATLAGLGYRRARRRA